MRTALTAAMLGAATFALAACGDSDSREVSVPGAGTVTTEGEGDNQTITVEGGGQQVVYGSGSAASAAGAPAYAQPYPGSDVQQSIQVPGQEGGMLVFRTEANPDTVIAYYQERAEAAGMASGTSMIQGDTRMYGAESSSGGGLQVMVAPVEGQSTVTVTWSEAG